MSVYVDKARNPYGRMLMSHMVADSIDELHAMAARIGLRREWFQRLSRPHYDVSQSKRAHAIAAGVIVLERKEFVKKVREITNHRRSLQP